MGYANDITMVCMVIVMNYGELLYIQPVIFSQALITC